MPKIRRLPKPNRIPGSKLALMEREGDNRGKINKETPSLRCEKRIEEKSGVNKKPKKSAEEGEREKEMMEVAEILISLKISRLEIPDGKGKDVTGPRM